MRRDGATIDGMTPTVGDVFGGRARYRGWRRGVQRTAASYRGYTKWRPRPRIPETLDRAFPLFLPFAALAVWVMCGFRWGYPDAVVSATLLAAVMYAVQVGALVGAAYVTSAVTSNGFGDLRGALLKFSGIVLAALAAHALLGDFAGLCANQFTFVLLVWWLFDVEPLDAALLLAFYVVLSTTTWLAAAAAFAG